MTRPLRLVPIVGLLSLLAVTSVAPTLAQDAAGNARTWIGREAELEEYLKTVQVISLDDIGTGVTKPKKGKIPPGGPMEALVFKPIRPGRYQGYWESYRSEVAAYELDKHLGLGMTPPTVERRVAADIGAAVMWAAPTQSFKDLGGVPGQGKVKGPPPAQIAAWMRQVTRAKMFDNLIGNIDPNLGNWLVDPSWNLILIDHTRAFTSTKNLYHQMASYDAELWEKIKALDEPTLKTVVGQWLERDGIKGILDRRQKMAEVIAKLKP